MINPLISSIPLCLAAAPAYQISRFQFFQIVIFTGCFDPFSLLSIIFTNGGGYRCPSVFVSQIPSCCPGNSGIQRMNSQNSWHSCALPGCIFSFLPCCNRIASPLFSVWMLPPDNKSRWLRLRYMLRWRFRSFLPLLFPWKLRMPLFCPILPTPAYCIC